MYLVNVNTNYTEKQKNPSVFLPNVILPYSVTLKYKKCKWSVVLCIAIIRIIVPLSFIMTSLQSYSG